MQLTNGQRDQRSEALAVGQPFNLTFGVAELCYQTGHRQGA
jgi:hypothetical protein